MTFELSETFQLLQFKNKILFMGILHSHRFFLIGDKNE